MDGDDKGLGDGIVVRTIFEAAANALVDWWYIWLLLVVVTIALAVLSAWSRSIAQRAKKRAR